MEVPVGNFFLYGCSFEYNPLASCLADQLMACLPNFPSCEMRMKNFGWEMEGNEREESDQDSLRHWQEALKGS